MSRINQFTLPTRGFQSLPSELGLGPKVKQTRGSTALHPRSFRRGKVGCIGRLRKGTLGVGRK